MVSVMALVPSISNLHDGSASIRCIFGWGPLSVPVLVLRTRLRHSKKKVSFSTPLVTSVRFVVPPDSDNDGGGGREERFELSGLECEIKRYRKRAMIDSQKNSRSRHVREKAALMEAEMNVGRKRWPRRVRKPPMELSSSAQIAGEGHCLRSGARRVSFAAPMCRVRWFPAQGGDDCQDLFYTKEEIDRFRTLLRERARGAGRELTAIEDASLVESLASSRCIRARKNFRQVSDSPVLSKPPPLRALTLNADDGKVQNNKLCKMSIRAGERFPYKKSGIPFEKEVMIDLNTIGNYTVSLVRPSGVVIEV